MTKVYNRVFTQEKWNLVNDYNKKLLSDYKMQIKSEGKSEKSIIQYYNDGRIILIYILEELNNKPLYELNRRSFRNFVLWMQENGMGSARVNRMLCTSRNLLNFGLDDDDYSDEFDTCKINPSRLKGMKKEKKREILFLTDNEVHVIFDDLIEKERFSEALLCALMYDSACRRNEAFQIKRYDISLDSNICKVPIRGKGGKMYRPIYNDLTKKAYSLLEESRTDNSEALWITKQGAPAAYETLYNQVSSWRKILKVKLGVDKEFNPHSFRHSCCDNLENGTHYIAVKAGKKFELTQIQKLMNHNDLSTTQSYLADRSEDELLEAFCM